jgi:hypothetical protein
MRSQQLDMLRGVAILLVLGHHMDLYSPGPAWPPPGIVRGWLRGGWIGVDLFFVLSGFLVSGLLFKEYKRHGSCPMPTNRNRNHMNRSMGWLVPRELHAFGSVAHRRILARVIQDAKPGIDGSQMGLVACRLYVESWHPILGVDPQLGSSIACRVVLHGAAAVRAGCTPGNDAGQAVQLLLRLQDE